jgi:hypothetical protein
MLGRIVNGERPVVVLFATRKVACERQSVRESELKLDFFAPQSRCCRQRRDLVERPFELLDAFNKRGSRQGALSGGAPPFDSVFGYPSLCKVMREQLRLALGNLRKLVFERFSNAGVQRVARLAQQRAVGRVSYQCVLEQISRVWWRTLPVQQPCRH